MNYPFGDSIFYTDQTPLISVPLKCLFYYIPSLAPNSITIYNWIIVLNMIVASYLCYFILQRFIKTVWILVAASVFLPWISPQYLRLLSGHMNLSLSCVVLGNVFLLIKLYEYQKNSTLILYTVFNYILLTFCFFIHAYYVFILVSFTGIFAFTVAIFRRDLKILLAGLSISLGSLISISLFMNYFDQYRKLRETNSMVGYNWEYWQMHWGNLFTSYNWNFIRFPFAALKFVNYENYGYLGSYFLFSLLFITLLIWWSGDKKNIFRCIFWESSSAKLLSAVIISGLLCGLMSFGETAVSMDGNYRFYNIFNPAFYLRNYVHELSHIRCMSRYIFPFIFTANISIIALLDYYWRVSNSKLISGTIILLFVFGFSDARDAVNQMNRDEWAKENPFSEARISSLKLPIQNYTSYQSILVIPFFHVGANNLSLEADQQTHKYAFQLAIKTGLPLMNSQMSRTPDYQVTAFANMFISDTIPAEIKLLLTEKPILVVLDKKLSADTVNYAPKEEPAHSIFIKANAFPAAMGMEILYEDDTQMFYKWLPKLKT